MNDSKINDNRQINEFKNTTFSKYKISDVLKELLNCIINGKIENACNWSAELICSGKFFELWNIILITFGKHIHLGNPKLPIYIENRFIKFKEILIKNYLDNEIEMRNNENIRLLFAEIICVLCFSIKKHSLDSIKIKNDEEFDITNISYKLKAPNISYANNIFKEGDPKEIFIAINEFIYHISVTKDNVNACKWIEWISTFEKICKKKKEKINCYKREIADVNPKFQNDIIWIFWEAILNEAKTHNNDLLNRIMNSLMHIYCIKFNPTIKLKRKFLIFFAISLLTENVNYNIEIIQNKKEMSAIISKINTLYKQIKNNEENQISGQQNKYSKHNTDTKPNISDKINKMNILNTIIPNKNI